MGDQSHIDDMRAAVRADFERARARREAEREPYAVPEPYQREPPQALPEPPPTPPDPPRRPSLIQRLAAFFRP